MNNILDQLSSQIHQLWQKHYPDKECYFHLSPCGGCSAPTWQTPCPYCGHYVVSRHDEHIARRDKEANRLSFRQFKAKIGQGNFAQFYFSHCKLDRAAAEAALLSDCPTPEEIWEAFFR